MPKAWLTLLALGLAVPLAWPAFAQGQAFSAQAAAQPRAPAARELCRILVPGLPPERQPPPLGCDAARRQAPIVGGEVVVVGRETRDSLRFNVADERYSRDQAVRDAREEARSRLDRDREWRDGTWDDRSRFDDDDLRVWPDD